MVKKRPEQTVRYLTWKSFDEAIKVMALEIKKKRLELNSITGIPRGGLVVAVALSHKLNLPFVLEPTLKTLVVDDICDTGSTLSMFKGYYTAVLVLDENSTTKPGTYCIVKKHNTWVVFPWEADDG